jgi:transposase
MEKPIEKRIARKAKQMTRYEIVLKTTAGKLTWLQAAEILGITPRHMRRLRAEYRDHGIDAFHDNRGGKPRRKRICEETVSLICRLKQEVYYDFSVQHFYEKLTEEHGVQISYSWTKHVLQEAGIVKKARGRGKYHRQRERRPMRGLMLHIDASTHEWIPGIPEWDLVAVMDDADGRLLYAQFFEEEGTPSTFAALHYVIGKHGRFCELYHDRASHFGRTSKAGERPDEEQNGQVTRALKALGIKQIFANTPQARGRSERAFGTVQGRIPQELRLAGIRTYQDANVFLDNEFKRSFNRSFAVRPRLPESVFVPMTGLDLNLLLSVQHERTVKNDNTVQFRRTILQLPSTRTRNHYVRCPVLVHELTKGTLAVTYQGNLVAEYTTDGELIKTNKPKRKRKSNKAA